MDADCDPQTIVDMWLNSPPHRKIMLSSAFQRIGVGRRGSSECYVTADFASASVASSSAHARGR